MSSTSTSNVTRWLAEWRDGDERALERLFPLVYGELRRLASRYVTATVIVGSQTYSGTDEVQYGGLTYTFQVASGVSSGTLKISVTCPTFLGQYIRIDDVCLSQI